MEPLLLQGDCLDVLPELPSASIDMIFCDLPYGTTQNAWDVKVELSALWKQLERVCSAQWNAVFTATQPFATELINSNHRQFRYDLIWQKNRYHGHASASRRPLRAHETVLVFSEGGHYSPQHRRVPGLKAQKVRHGVSRENRNTGLALQGEYHVVGDTRHPLSVLPFNRDDKRDGLGHPTQKPVGLLEWLIASYCPPGGCVLDPTAGAMTTAVAAINLGYRSVCIERDTLWFARGSARVRQALEAAA